MSTVSDELPTEEPAERDRITLPDPDEELSLQDVMEDATVADARAYEPPTIETLPNPPDWTPPVPELQPRPPILANPPHGSQPPRSARADTELNPFSDDDPQTVADVVPTLPPRPSAARSEPSLQVARSLDELQRWVEQNRTAPRPWPQRVTAWSQRRGFPPWAPFAASGAVLIALLVMIARC